MAFRSRRASSPAQAPRGSSATFVWAALPSDADAGSTQHQLYALFGNNSAIQLTPGSAGGFFGGTLPDANGLGCNVIGPTTLTSQGTWISALRGSVPVERAARGFRYPNASELTVLEFMGCWYLPEQFAASAEAHDFCGFGFTSYSGSNPDSSDMSLCRGVFVGLIGSLSGNRFGFQYNPTSGTTAGRVRGALSLPAGFSLTQWARYSIVGRAANASRPARVSFYVNGALLYELSADVFTVPGQGTKWGPVVRATKSTTASTQSTRFGFRDAQLIIGPDDASTWRP